MKSGLFTLLFAVICVLAPGLSFGQQECASAVAGVNKTIPLSEVKTSSLRGQKIDYQELLENPRHGAVRARNLRPDLDPEHRLILSVSSTGHTSLQYKNYRIDSGGSAGFQGVTSYLHESTLIPGAFVIILSDLPADTIAKLDQLVQNFKETSRFTCVRATCDYLQQASPEIIGKPMYRSISLVKALMKYKEKGGAVDVVALQPGIMDDALSQLTVSEVNVAVENGVPAFSVAAFIAVLGARAAGLL